MLKRVIFWGTVLAVGIIVFCLMHIRFDLSQNLDNTEHTDNTEFVG